MKTSLQENISAIKRKLSAEDILVHSFTAGNGVACAIVYADGIVDKELLGRLVVEPLAAYRQNAAAKEMLKAIAYPELKTETAQEAICAAVLDGNPALFLDGADFAAVVGTKKPPARALTEPQTELVVKGPRAGFIEDIKTNMGQLRLRFKTENLQFELFKIGRQSKTNVAVCYLQGIASEEIVKEIKAKLEAVEIDALPDSSYLSHFLCPGRPSVFKQIGTTEKPDVLAAKMAEGRIGILVDGSPVALTLPYLLVEEFQSPEDYFVNPYRATFTRLLRIGVMLLSIYLPALYVAAQLFKLQLIPLGLLFTIASSIQGLPLSPSLEVLLTLLVLEILNEASIRMPKYVGLALSVVGALVLGETEVKAGVISTPTVILIAFSGIGLYTVPDLVQTTSLLRLCLLVIAGSVGTYGIVLFSAFLLVYLVGKERYGAPLLAPFAPIVANDLKESLVKFPLASLTRRPAVFKSKNKTRLKGA